MEKLDKETLEIHEKMRKHFTPLNGYIIIEYVENLKTAGGVYLPHGSEETKAIAHPIVQTPKDPDNKFIDTLHPGDWVSLRAMQVDVFKMYGRKFAMVRDFDIMMKVDMSYIKDEALYKEILKSKTVIN